MSVKLTAKQEAFLKKLNRTQNPFLADDIRTKWEAGKSAYIDSRVDIRDKLRQEFNRLNK